MDRLFPLILIAVGLTLVLGATRLQSVVAAVVGFRWYPAPGWYRKAVEAVAGGRPFLWMLRLLGAAWVILALADILGWRQ